MLPRTQLIRIQRSLYDRLRSQAKGVSGGMNEALKTYYTEYQKDFIRFKGFATKSQLLEDLKRAQIAFCGDYHTLGQSQKTAVRLLREVEKPIVLALEMLRAEHDEWAEGYLTGSLSEKQFLQKIGFKKNWGFQWNTYRPLFDFAREAGIAIVGLTPRKEESLRGRDEFAARRLVEISAELPEALVFALMGDLHMAESHLPGEVKKLLEMIELKRHVLTIHQNYDPYYWELVELGMESFIEVIQIKDDAYCVLNTPPWIKLQSHLRWLDVDYEFDFTDEFHEIVGFIATFLGLEQDIPENFEVYRPVGKDFLKPFRLEKDFSGTKRKLLATYAKTFRGFFVPRRNLVFLSDVSLNQLSTQAGIYLHSELSQFDRVFQNPKTDFYAFVWVEALGFIGSKIINLRRKCSRPDSAVAKAVFEHLAWEQAPSKKALPFLKQTSRVEEIVFAYRIAKHLGQLLGQAIYGGLIEHKVKHSEVSALFADAFQSPKKAQELYLAWAQRLDEAGLREVANVERLLGSRPA